MDAFQVQKKEKKRKNSEIDCLLEGPWVFFLFFFLAMHAERNSDIKTLSKRRKQFKSHFNGNAFLRSMECFLYKGWMILKTFRKIFLTLKWNIQDICLLGCRKVVWSTTTFRQSTSQQWLDNIAVYTAQNPDSKRLFFPVSCKRRNTLFVNLTFNFLSCPHYSVDSFCW